MALLSPEYDPDLSQYVITFLSLARPFPHKKIRMTSSSLWEFPRTHTTKQTDTHPDRQTDCYICVL